MSVWVERIRRGFHRSPAEIWRRVGFEVVAQAERYRRAPAVGLSSSSFAQQFGASDLNVLWDSLRGRPFPAITAPVAVEEYETYCPGDTQRIRQAADNARSRTVDLLGSGQVKLATPIKWQVDFKVGLGWPDDFFRDIDIIDRHRGTDIKVPWELSRLQWLIPVGQQFLLDGADEDAEIVREILEEWISANPYGRGPNWASTMEAAMRGMVWIWLFHVFAGSAAWSDPDFRERFLRTLFAHGVFVRRHLERFGVDGNHLTANAAGLVVMGSFLDGRQGRSWAETGWRLIEELVPDQVLSDGVCFEASAAYHRFVAELIYVAVHQREILGQSVADEVRSSLSAMGSFAAAYTGPDAEAPLWGDSDDGRVLPFGGQAARDHSYLPRLVSAESTWDGQVVPSRAALPEVFWALGASEFGASDTSDVVPTSSYFGEAGVITMRGPVDHLFADVGPVGFAGLGGHGHNDCLSFELSLVGARLIEDSGTFVYTASLNDRDKFRSTAAHSTPQIDDAEQNRLPAGEPFRLSDDARPEIRAWVPGDRIDVFTASHSGYLRFDPAIRPVRTFCLDKARHGALISDRFESTEAHKIRVPYHFAHGTSIVEAGAGCWNLKARGNSFTIVVEQPESWTAELVEGWVSPSYGVRMSRPVLVFSRDGSVAPLTVGILSGALSRAEALAWVAELEASLMASGGDA